MINKKVGLFFIAVLTVLLLFCLPFYNRWLYSKFGDEGPRMLYESDHLSVDDRMEARFGNTYVIQKSVEHMLDGAHCQDALILLPPNGYVAMMKLKTSFEVPEPAVFYYFTGYRAVTKNSPQIAQANWAMLVEKHRIALRRINNKHFLDSLLTLYAPYN